MKNNIIIFDIDETITKKNFHQLILEEWIKESIYKKYSIKLLNGLIKILIKPFKRKFEYMPIILINENYLKNITPKILNNINNVNYKVIKKIEKYKKNGYKVLFISAASEKTVNQCAEFYNVDYISSKTKYGFITNDLLGKKNKVYEELLSNGFNIMAIYSDSTLDLSNHSRKNFLVDANGDMKIYSK